MWALTLPCSPKPFVGIWSRGAGKSTHAELSIAAVAARRVRRYGLYLSGTQSKADDHVANTVSLFEDTVFANYYPDVAAPSLSRTGYAKGWRRNRMRTRSGFTLDAIGLDTDVRGRKLDEDRPDFIIIDDVDGELDTPEATHRKITTLTTKVLPAGTNNLAVLAIQNLIISQGIFSRLAGIADERADFLHDRIVSGPHPAIRDLVWERDDDGRPIIVGGEPTWSGMSLEACQRIVEKEGISAFLKERQHEVEGDAGGLFTRIPFYHCMPDEVPQLVRIVVAVDPAVTDTRRSDSHGLCADGIAVDGTIYRLWAWEGRTSPTDSLSRALLKAVDLGADAVIVETDQGGDAWKSVYRESWDILVAAGKIPEGATRPPFRNEKAGSIGSKTHRANMMLADYERPRRIIHVMNSSTAVLEKALRRFPIRKPFDLADAAFWSWYALRRPQPSIRWL